MNAAVRASPTLRRSRAIACSASRVARISGAAASAASSHRRDVGDDRGVRADQRDASHVVLLD
jgi:hypothetical protein